MKIEYLKSIIQTSDDKNEHVFFTFTSMAEFKVNRCFGHDLHTYLEKRSSVIP
jgi:hypothetical protein